MEASQNLEVFEIASRSQKHYVHQARYALGGIIRKLPQHIALDIWEQVCEQEGYSSGIFENKPFNLKLKLASLKPENVASVDYSPQDRWAMKSFCPERMKWIIQSAHNIWDWLDLQAMIDFVMEHDDLYNFQIEREYEAKLHELYPNNQQELAN